MPAKKQDTEATSEALDEATQLAEPEDAIGGAELAGAQIASNDANALVASAPPQSVPDDE